MTNPEFSDQFDVLYNNITSNQAPGLDEYEKSVFLTKAQDEIVKSYFNPRSNKTQEGFDGNEKRQIDFSMIIRSSTYQEVEASTSPLAVGEATTAALALEEERVIYTPKANLKLPSSNISLALNSSTQVTPEISIVKDTTVSNRFLVSSDEMGTLDASIDKSLYDIEYLDVYGTKLNAYTNEVKTARYNPFKSPIFDFRSNSKSVTILSDIMMFVNEYVEVTRNGKSINLAVLPINYTEYSRLMNKPFKRPLKNQAWRLLESSGGKSTAELIVGAGDKITKYVIRYIKRPQAIILDNLDGVTLGGKSTAQDCELDPILHEEILQRAVELAKAAYIGDLQSQIALGGASQTNIGFVSSKQ